MFDFIRGSGNEQTAFCWHNFLSKYLQLREKWMYLRQNVRDLTRMIEVGLLKFGGPKQEDLGQINVRRDLRKRQRLVGLTGR
jgi:hypothetical protein